MKNILLILTLGLLWGCHHEKRECGHCFTPPEAFLFEIVDTTTGENLFANGTFSSTQIEVTNTENSSPVEYSFIGENNANIIFINAIGWHTEKVNLSVKIAEITVFFLYVDAERLFGDCCSYTIYNEITIKNAPYELDTKTGIYKIVYKP